MTKSRMWASAIAACAWAAAGSARADVAPEPDGGLPLPVWLAAAVIIAGIGALVLWTRRKR